MHPPYFHVYLNSICCVNKCQETSNRNEKKDTEKQRIFGYTKKDASYTNNKKNDKIEKIILNCSMGGKHGNFA